MRIIIHADPGEAGLTAANRVRDKIVRRVAAADGVTEVVQAEAPRIVMSDLTGEDHEFRGRDPDAIAWAGGGPE